MLCCLSRDSMCAVHVHFFLASGLHKLSKYTKYHLPYDERVLRTERPVPGLREQGEEAGNKKRRLLPLLLKWESSDFATFYSSCYTAAIRYDDGARYLLTRSSGSYTSDLKAECHVMIRYASVVQGEKWEGSDFLLLSTFLEEGLSPVVLHHSLSFWFLVMTSQPLSTILHKIITG